MLKTVKGDSSKDDVYDDQQDDKSHTQCQQKY